MGSTDLIALRTLRNPPADMNRIYQGRVRDAELIDSKTGAPLPPPPDWNWETALWEHHQLFQDAVNYYAFALAAMAEGMVEQDKDGKEKPTAMAQFAEQVFGRWDDFYHKGGKRAGVKHSLAHTLGLDANSLKPQECIDRIFSHAFEMFPKRADGKLHDVFRGVIGELFQEGRGLQPKNMANEDPSWLCWTNKPEKENTPAKSFYRKKRGIWGFMDELFAADANGLKKLSKCSVEESCLTSVESGDPTNQSEGADYASDAPEQESDGKSSQPDERLFFVGAKAISQLEAYLASARTALSDQAFLRDFRLLGGHDFDTDLELARLASKIAEAKSKLVQPRTRSFSSAGNAKDRKRGTGCASSCFCSSISMRGHDSRRHC